MLVAATAITLAAASLAGRARRRAHCAQRLVRALSPLILGMPLQAWQWALLLWKHNSTVQADLTPWPLYCWSALLAWCTWRVALLIRRLEITRTTMWAVVLGACALALGVNGFVQYKLWDALSFGYHDIGLFARALHNAAEGRGLYVDSLGYVTLAEHADFLLWALVPACMVGASPFHLLVFTSAACFAVPAIIVAWYLRRCLGSNFAGLLGALAWLFLPSHGCLVLARGYGFHPVYLAVPLLVAGRSLSSVRRWGAATACTLIACLAREEVSLTVPAWGGLYVAVVDKRRLLGLGVAAACAAYFYRTVFVVIPLVRGKAYPWIAAHYRVEAAAGGEGVRLATDAAFVVTLLLPMAIVAARPSWLLLLGLPALVETILTTNAELHNLSVHYYTPLIPVLFTGAIRAWQQLAAPPHQDLASASGGERGQTLRAPGTPGFSMPPGVGCSEPVPFRHGLLALRVGVGPAGARKLRAGWCLLASACFGQAYLGIGPQTNNPPRPMSPPELARDLKDIELLRSTVSREVSVTASYRIAAHFLDCESLWTVGNEQIGALVVVDDRDHWDGSRPRQALVRAQNLGGYQPVLADYHLVALLKSSGASPLARSVRPAELPRETTRCSLELGASIRLVGRRIELEESATCGPRKCRVTLIWECSGSVPADYRFGLVLGEGRLRWGPFYFARGAYPTEAWKRGELYRDDVDIAVPPIEATELDSVQVVLLE